MRTIKQRPTKLPGSALVFDVAGRMTSMEEPVAGSQGGAGLVVPYNARS